MENVRVSDIGVDLNRKEGKEKVDEKYDFKSFVDKVIEASDKNGDRISKCAITNNGDVMCQQSIHDNEKGLRFDIRRINHNQVGSRYSMTVVNSFGEEIGEISTLGERSKGRFRITNPIGPALLAQDLSNGESITPIFRNYGAADVDDQIVRTVCSYIEAINGLGTDDSANVESVDDLDQTKSSTDTAQLAAD